LRPRSSMVTRSRSYSSYSATFDMVAAKVLST
jgi:hypothetical protein